ncbi:ribose-5-phosphate isomerase RpiA [bacterium]|nr:ribose-5-phosphate isomerase RpiA [bacterium]
MSTVDELKKEAGIFAVDHFVRPGMLVGLGVGSTAIHAIRHLGEKLQSGELNAITAIACGTKSEAAAREYQIPLVEFKPDTRIDVTIDGADEVDPQLNVIKGGGGALTREKIVAQVSRKEVIIVDESKLSQKLGEKWHIPIEVVPFGWQSQMGYLESLGAVPQLRMNEGGTPYQTDQHNFIIDANFGPIENPIFLGEEIKRRTGIVEHGLFLNLVSEVVVASPEGVRLITHEG